jgi:putative membrane protein
MKIYFLKNKKILKEGDTMKRTVLILLLIAAFSAFAVSAYAQDQGSAVAKQDMKFISEAASGGLLEVELGNYVAQAGSSPEVKSFAQRMVTDHSKANKELMPLAENKQIKLPKEMGKKDMATFQKLKSMQGADLDKEYMKRMVQDHKKDIKAFSTEAKKGKDPDIKAFAANTLPVLQEHLKLAQDIQKKMK